CRRGTLTEDRLKTPSNGRAGPELYAGKFIKARVPCERAIGRFPARSGSHFYGPWAVPITFESSDSKTQGTRGTHHDEGENRDAVPLAAHTAAAGAGCD